MVVIRYILYYNILERHWIKTDIAVFRSEMQKPSENANTQNLSTVVVIP